MQAPQSSLVSLPVAADKKSSNVHRPVAPVRLAASVKLHPLPLAEVGPESVESPPESALVKRHSSEKTSGSVSKGSFSSKQ